MKKLILLLVLVLSGSLVAQVTVEQQLVVTQNDGVNGGSFKVAVQLKGTNLTAAKTLGAATIDVSYDNAKLTWVNGTFNAGIGGATGYSRSATNNTTFIRVLITGAAVNENGGGDPPGFDLAATYATIVTLNFTIVDNTQLTSHSIAAGSNDVGIFANPNNNPLTGVINSQTLSPTVGITNEALPVQLSNFAAAMDYRNARLSWSTATETNNHGFEIERRAVGGNGAWAKVGFVPGAGTSTSPREYSYVDANVPPGRYAYQLKQVDTDGKYSYSGSVEIEIGVAAREFALTDAFPNPFNPATTIEFSVPNDGHATLKVFNVLGQEVATLFNGIATAGRFNQARFDATNLPTGLYFSRLEFDGKSMMKKLMLTK